MFGCFFKSIQSIPSWPPYLADLSGPTLLCLQQKCQSFYLSKHQYSQVNPIQSKQDLKRAKQHAVYTIIFFIVCSVVVDLFFVENSVILFAVGSSILIRDLRGNSFTLRFDRNRTDINRHVRSQIYEKVKWKTVILQ